VGDDLHAVAAGEVSITPLNLNLTATPLMDSIAESLA
jgi:broad specificity polyphosphatase/5'/3'-nucleotidase SurE